MNDLRPIDWTPERIEYLRRVLVAAARNGWTHITLPDQGPRVTVEYARHILTCLEDTCSPN